MLHGHDVSNYQGQYNWAQVKGSDAFGIAKATEGTGYTDPEFTRNWAQMKSSGLLRGAYHFARPDLNAPAQAVFFVGAVRPHGLDADDVLILDLEVTGGLGPSAVAAWAQAFCAKTQALTGKNVWIYTDHSLIWNGCCSGLYKQPLWIAAPGAAGSPGNVAPWPVWTAHQYTSVPVDQNVFNGDAGTWGKLANITQPTPVWSLAKYETTGKETLGTWARSVNHLPSTVLRLTCEHSPGDLFPANVAQYLNEVFTGVRKASDPMPAGLALWYMKGS